MIVRFKKYFCFVNLYVTVPFCCFHFPQKYANFYFSKIENKNLILSFLSWFNLFSLIFSPESPFHRRSHGKWVL